MKSICALIDEATLAEAELTVYLLLDSITSFCNPFILIHSAKSGQDHMGNNGKNRKEEVGYKTSKKHGRVKVQY